MIQINCPWCNGAMYASIENGEIVVTTPLGKKHDISKCYQRVKKGLEFKTFTSPWIMKC